MLYMDLICGRWFSFIRDKRELLPVAGSSVVAILSKRSDFKLFLYYDSDHFLESLEKKN